MKCSCIEGYAGVSKHTTDLKYLEHHNCNIPAVSCTLHIAKYTLAKLVKLYAAVEKAMQMLADTQQT